MGCKRAGVQISLSRPLYKQKDIYSIFFIDVLQTFGIVEDRNRRGFSVTVARATHQWQRGVQFIVPLHFMSFDTDKFPTDQDIKRAVTQLSTLYPKLAFMISRSYHGCIITFPPSPLAEWITVEIDQSVFNFSQCGTDPFLAVVEQNVDDEIVQ